LFPACLYHPFSKYLAEGERSVYPTCISYAVIVRQRARPTESAAMGNYTRGAAANQLDDGIGDTFVLGPVE